MSSFGKCIEENEWCVWFSWQSRKDRDLPKKRKFSAVIEKKYFQSRRPVICFLCFRVLWSRNIIISFHKICQNQKIFLFPTNFFSSEQVFRSIWRQIGNFPGFGDHWREFWTFLHTVHDILILSVIFVMISLILFDISMWKVDHQYFRTFTSTRVFFLIPSSKLSKTKKKSSIGFSAPASLGFSLQPIKITRTGLGFHPSRVGQINHYSRTKPFGALWGNFSG